MKLSARQVHFVSCYLQICEDKGVSKKLLPPCRVAIKLYIDFGLKICYPFCSAYTYECTYECVCVNVCVNVHTGVRTSVCTSVRTSVRV